MTSKERILAALHGKPADHVPFSPYDVEKKDLEIGRSGTTTIELKE
jgi:hypothetical protein